MLLKDMIINTSIDNSDKDRVDIKLILGGLRSICGNARITVLDRMINEHLEKIGFRSYYDSLDNRDYRVAVSITTKRKNIVGSIQDAADEIIISYPGATLESIVLIDNSGTLLVKDGVLIHNLVRAGVLIIATDQESGARYAVEPSKILKSTVKYVPQDIRDYLSSMILPSDIVV